MLILDGAVLASTLAIILYGIYEAVALVVPRSWPTISAIVQKWTGANSFIATLIVFVVLAAGAALGGHFLRWF